VPLVKKGLLTLQEVVDLTLCFSSCYSFFSFLCSILPTICLLFLLFVSVLSVLLQIMALDYQLDTCQLFVGFDLVYGVQRYFQQYVNYIVSK